MDFAWKALIPIALSNIAIVGLVVVLLPNAYLIPLAIVNWVALLGLTIIGPRLLQRVLRSNAQNVQELYRLRGRDQAATVPPEPSRVAPQATANRVGR
jgi:hypothetical protein